VQRLNSTFSFYCRVVIINSISIFLDCIGLTVLSYAHVDSSTASHRHCVQRGGLICKCIRRHPPPLTLITLHIFTRPRRVSANACLPIAERPLIFTRPRRVSANACLPIAERPLIFTRPRRVSANACLPIAERPLFSWHRSLVGHYRRVGSDCYYQTSRQTSLRSFVRGLFIIVPPVAAGPAGSAPAVRD
jgi:hypothetical protein